MYTWKVKFYLMKLLLKSKRETKYKSTEQLKSTHLHCSRKQHRLFYAVKYTVPWVHLQQASVGTS